jgi:hypothetical protein
MPPCDASLRLAERSVIAAAPPVNARCPCWCPFLAGATPMVRVPHLRFRLGDSAIDCSRWSATPTRHECISVTRPQSTTSPCPSLLKTYGSPEMVSQDVPAVKGEGGNLGVLISRRDVRMTSTAHVGTAFCVTSRILHRIDFIGPDGTPNRRWLGSLSSNHRPKDVGSPACRGGRNDCRQRGPGGLVRQWAAGNRHIQQGSVDPRAVLVPLRRFDN